MYAEDFEYDGTKLSDFGFVICNFNEDSGITNLSAGAEIVFDTVPVNHGRRRILTGSKYQECLSATFDIIKDPCANENIAISDSEYIKLLTWLNRHKFLNFNFVNTEEVNILRYYKASFNIEDIRIDDTLYGLHLNMTTDKPFCYGYDKSLSKLYYPTSVNYILPTNENGMLIYSLDQFESFDGYTRYQNIYINNYSNELGFVPLNIKFNTGSASGTIRFYNETTGENTYVYNTSPNETITIDSENKIISSDLELHKIYNDFNFVFPRLERKTLSLSTYNNKLKFGYDNPNKSEKISSVELSYHPIIKGSIF